MRNFLALALHYSLIMCVNAENHTFHLLCLFSGCLRRDVTTPMSNVSLYSMNSSNALGCRNMPLVTLYGTLKFPEFLFLFLAK